MRILMLNHLRRYRSWHRAGDFAVHLAARGHEVTLIVLSDRERYRFAESLHRGIRLVECPDLLVGNARAGWDPVCALRRVLWLARDGRGYDVMHLFETRPATIIPGLWFARKTATPLAIDWNDWWGRGGIISVRRPWWYRLALGGVETFFEEYFRRFAHVTTVISNGLCRRAVSLGINPDSIVHVRPGIDGERFSDEGRAAVRQRLGYSYDDVVIGYSSQDTFYDMSAVLEGARIAHARQPRIRLLLIGKHTPAVSQAVRRRGLESFASLAGFVSDVDYPKYLAAVDAFVVPFPETVYNIGRWPNKFGDYLGAGRPVVFNPVGDLADFADDPPGIPCSFDAESFAQAFSRLARDPDARTRFRRRARELVHTRFDWNAQVQLLENAYALAQSRAQKAYRVEKRRGVRVGSHLKCARAPCADRCS